MKTKLYALALITAVLFCFAPKAKAQQNVIKLNPLSLAVLTLNVQYERALSQATSAQLGVFYTGFSFNVGDGKWSYSGVGITPEFRYYVTNSAQDAPRGLYVGPWVRYQSFNTKIVVEDFFTGQEEEGKISATNIGGGAILGYQWLFGDSFSLDMFLGPGYGSGSSKVVTDTSTGLDEDDLIGVGSGLRFRFGLTVGVAF